MNVSDNLNISGKIYKKDMITIVINENFKSYLLQLFTDKNNWMGSFGIIRYEKLKDNFILSFVDSKSRDELYNNLVDTITSSLQ